MVVAPDRWVLKGAVALHFRLGARARTTKDLDLAGWNSEPLATADFLAAQATDLGDHFQFAMVKTSTRAATQEGAAIRYRVLAHLAGRRFEDVTVDVGLSDPAIVGIELLRGPELLRFAEIEPIEVPALPIGPHVAEKVHAYTRSYAGGRSSTRVKDLIDLALVASLFPLVDAGALRSALLATFDTRGTHPLPSALPQPPAEWRVAYRRMAAELGLNDDVNIGYEEVRSFLDPVLAGVVPDDACWDPARRTW
jgi:hypothetical protein